MKPVLIDLFCGGGGATRGYQDVGFYVIGVDNRPQKHYIGDEFYQADWLEFVKSYRGPVDAWHASPPCQGYSNETPKKYRNMHRRLIVDVRKVLIATNKPYVIETVTGARKELINPIMLCGSMFGLRVWRHRYFEIYPNILRLSNTCNHSKIPVLVTAPVILRREAMGIDWNMPITGLDQAIPPAYTRRTGRYIMEYLRR